MRQNGHGTLTLEDARTWIEETGLCLFLPKRQYSSSIAPSFVEAVAGRHDATPDPKHIAVAEELLVRLETDGVAVRLNLLGLPGEQPDFVVASWVLPYVYALRGDRDWRRSPQLTGSRQVSQLAVQAYKQLETGDATIAELKRALGREVTEGAVLRAITELWQQLRIIPVVSAPGHSAQWQLLRQRYQKAIAEGASTSQVTAISVLASIYLQAVIAATMEEVELFLASLTARSKVREVLRGLVATRQVHTISMGHAPLFYVAGTLPEFAEPATIYASSSMPAHAYYLRSRDHEEDAPVFEAPKPASLSPATLKEPRKPADSHTTRRLAPHKTDSSGKSAAERPHFSRPRRAAHSRDRKPAQGSSSSRPNSRSGSRPARRSNHETRPSGARPASGARWKTNSPASSHSKRNGTNARAGSSKSARSNGSATRQSNGASGKRNTKATASARGQRNGHVSGVKATGKSTGNARAGSLSRNGSASRKDARSVRGSSSRKPALTAGRKTGNSKRFGFTARPKQKTKKRA
jgi:hypothetical protein